MKAPDKYNFNRVSASQLKRFEKCPRKWFFQYPLGMKPSPNKAMMYGIERHDDIEHFLNGEKDELHTVEAKAIQEAGEIPSREEALAEVSYRKPIFEEDGDVVDISGRLDCVHVEDLMPVISDWKFRSSIGNQSSEDLKKDIQLVCYAWAFPGMTGLKWDNEKIKVRLVECLKKHKGGPDVKVTSVVLEKEYIETFVEKNVHPLIRRMKACAERALPQVRENRAVCYEYGPCPHLDLCRDVDFEPVDSSPIQNDQGDDAMTNIDDIMSKKENRTGDKDSTPSESDEQSDERSETEVFDASDVLEALREHRDVDDVEIAGVDPLEISIEGSDPFELSDPADVYPSVEKAVEAVLGDREKQDEEKEPDTDDGSIQPPDAEPDREPKTLDEIKIEDFNWDDIDGVGAKKAEKIRKTLHSEGYRTLADLVEDGYDFEAIKGVGESNAKTIKKTVKEAGTWEPDGTAEADVEKKSVGDMRTLQQRIDDAKDELSEDFTWKPDLVDQSDVEAADSASDLATTMETRISRETLGDDNPAVQNPAEPSKPSESSEPDSEPSDMTPKADSDLVDEIAGADSSDNDSNKTVLAINCQPLHDDDFVRLWDLLEPLKEELADELDVPHWNAAEFAKGEKNMGRKVLEHVDEFDGRKIVCEDDSYPGMASALEVLLPRADKIFKG